MKSDEVYMKPFKNIFQIEQNHKFASIGTGPTNGFTFVLDAHTLTGAYKTGKSKSREFGIAIHEPGSFPLVSFGGIKVMAGQKTSIVMSPKILESSQGIRGKNIK